MMFKSIQRRIALFTLIISSSKFAYAGTPYVGGGLGVGGYKSQPGTSANLFAGYGSKFGKNQNLYLGGELNGEVSHYSMYQTNYGIGLSLLPGVMLSQYTMLYGRVGIDNQYTANKMNANKYNFGTQYGLGLQSQINKNWDVRGEYVYSNAKQDGQYNLGFLYHF